MEGTHADSGMYICCHAVEVTDISQWYTYCQYYMNHHQPINEQLSSLERHLIIRKHSMHSIFSTANDVLTCNFVCSNYTIDNVQEGNKHSLHVNFFSHQPARILAGASVEIKIQKKIVYILITKFYLLNLKRVIYLKTLSSQTKPQPAPLWSLFQ